MVLYGSVVLYGQFPRIDIVDPPPSRAPETHQQRQWHWQPLLKFGSHFWLADWAQGPVSQPKVAAGPSQLAKSGCWAKSASQKISTFSGFFSLIISGTSSIILGSVASILKSLSSNSLSSLAFSFCFGCDVLVWAAKLCLLTFRPQWSHWVSCLLKK